MEADAMEFVKKCPPCQMHANFHVAPPEELISLTSPWPFSKCGNGPTRTIPTGPRPSQIPHSRNRLLHQVDRGRASSLDLGKTKLEVLMEEHNIEVWNSTFHNN
ncbi:hypothetical protein PIB30_017009 [Stylosanthes scabra]|uniref:Uncharacterized protein n=1 Tax=Stylosanthes scabra TaxID=79078 RepID=A0ABU6Q8E4_9FABA|nr:hypothetical protein [Stylosanthes scabra]